MLATPLSYIWSFKSNNCWSLRINYIHHIVVRAYWRIIDGLACQITLWFMHNGVIFTNILTTVICLHNVFVYFINLSVQLPKQIEFHIWYCEKMKTILRVSNDFPLSIRYTCSSHYQLQIATVPSSPRFWLPLSFQLVHRSKWDRTIA